ncbi:UNVERIFIED_CONTAM: hypothetical protein FKN15_058332 [Acipenser sinensis]
MSNPGTRRNGSSIKIRLTVLCAKNLAKKDFFRLPDPFAKIVVDGSGQCHSTDTVKNTLDPKWNQHYDLYIGKTDSITISVWNHKKIHKKQGAGFLGCVRLLSNAISRLKDTGYQRLDLCKLNPTDSDAVRGQIVVSLQTRDRIGTGGPVVDCRGLLENEGPVFEDSGPGRPLSCFMEEPLPYTDSTGAAGGGNCRFLESPNQEQRLQAQRIRNQDARGHTHTPQNRPHGSQSPELPEGYGSQHSQVKESGQQLPVQTEVPPEDGEAELPVRYERDLVQKLKLLRHELSLQQPQAGHCRIEVSREEIFEESYRQIMKMRPKDLKKRLMVKFRGEEGLDYGGVAREWLYLLCHEMLNPYYGLFQYSTDNIYTLQINPDSSINPDHLSYFHFVGRIMGLAVFHGHYINGGFTLPFYKQLLGKPIQLSDLETVDPELHKSLVWILENDITPVLDHTFCVEHNAFGKFLQHELKPNGRNIPVMEENKKEYVRLYVNWRFMRGIEAQFLALQKGFNELIPQHLLKPFEHKELELIGGLGKKLDLNDWKANTRLKHCVADSNMDHLSYFHFVGRIMGLAVFHGHYINGGFTLPFYKQLLGKPIQLSDLETVDPELHKSLVWILENDITPVLDHTFCVEHNAFGKFLQHELKPNGRNIPVTEENKKEYVRLYVNWRFMRGIEAQFLALQKGFNELIPQHLLKPFEHKELELIIGGLGKLDLNDWKANTRLKHCVADSNMVKCFNRIDIPPYETYEKLYEKLVTAVEETCGFAVE